MTTNILKEFIEQSLYRIDESTRRILRCLGEVEENQIWKSPNENSNSIGNLVLHLSGNIRQYIISAIGDADDTRVRKQEFSTKSGFNKEELLKQLEDTVSHAKEIIKGIGDEKLAKTYSVQGFQLSGIGIIIHVTEHYSYHTGQIAFWTKQLKNKDLAFYGDVDLNAKNKK